MSKSFEKWNFVGGFGWVQNNSIVKFLQKKIFFFDPEKVHKTIANGHQLRINL